MVGFNIGFSSNTEFSMWHMLKFEKVGPIGVPIPTPLVSSYNDHSGVLNGIFVAQILRNSSNIS